MPNTLTVAQLLQANVALGALVKKNFPPALARRLGIFIKRIRPCMEEASDLNIDTALKYGDPDAQGNIITRPGSYAAFQAEARALLKQVISSPDYKIPDGVFKHLEQSKQTMTAEHMEALEPFVSEGEFPEKEDDSNG